jgi:hypothetical protein
MTSELAEPKDFYVWEPPGKGISVHLSYDVIDQLLQEAMQGLGAVPRRGVEVGGILLGTVEEGAPRIVKIEDFSAVQCEYASGPSYSLSDNDKRRLEAQLQQWGRAPDRLIYAVGYFRSHTRKDLFLSDADLALCSQYFSSPSDVVLLIRPFVTRTSLGGFFFWEHGKISREASCLEFPFNRKELGGGDPPARVRRRRHEGEEEEKPANTVAVPPPPAEDRVPPLVMPPPQARRTFSKWAILALIFLVLGGLLGFVAAPYLRVRIAGPAPENPYSFGLTATDDGDHVRIRWNRQSPLIQAARGGRITIVDDGSTRVVDLDVGQLQNGTVIYRKISAEVDVRMEVFVENQGAVSESVQVKAANVPS